MSGDHFVHSPRSDRAQKVDPLIVQDTCYRIVPNAFSNPTEYIKHVEAQFMRSIADYFRADRMVILDKGQLIFMVTLVAIS